MKISLALIGDYNERVIAHPAIPRALMLAGAALGSELTWKWIETNAIHDPCESLAAFSGIWVVPGSPYANMEGVINSIQFARETGRPFLGTCGGFQHALIEYARNVCGIHNADHAESNQDAESLIVVPLLCSLVDKSGTIHFSPGSRLEKIYDGELGVEGYHCNYGLNPDWRIRLEEAGLSFTGFDTADEVRAFEFSEHPFFIGTLFQPERSALREERHPLITAFVKAASSMF